MKKVAIILNQPIINDSRMIKIINTLSKVTLIDLFYLNGEAIKDGLLFNNNVRLFPIKSNDTFLTKLIRHSLFYNELNYFVDHVLKTNELYDFIYSCDLPTLKPGVILKDKLKAQLIYDSHELYVEGLNQFFPSKNSSGFIKSSLFNISLSLMKYSGFRAERKFLKKVDFFVTTSQSYKKYFEEKYNYNGIKIVMNCPLKLERKKLVDFKSLYDWEENSFILIYIGNMNPGRGIELLIETIKKCPSNFKLILMGSGTLKNKYQHYIKNQHLENRIKFPNAVPFSDIIGTVMSCDLGVNLLETINLNKRLASTNKLFEYIHAGIPILATDSYENEIVISKYKTGYLVKNEVEDIYEKIILAEKNKFNFNKSNFDAAIDHFNWQNQESILLEIVK